MIKVSIIVPVYNVELYLKHCLDSLVNQTLKDIEIICVNDGSTDNSLSILEEYAQKYSVIKVIDKENGGISSARNIAISQAKGEYLGFVDSDDWVDLDYFEKLYNTAKKYNSDIACAGYKRQRPNRAKIVDKLNEEIFTNDINIKLKLANIPAHNYVWNKIYKTSVWQEKNFAFETGRNHEDMIISLKLLNEFESFVSVPNTYYNYRFTNTSIVTQRSVQLTKDYKFAIKLMQRYADENNIRLDFGALVIEKHYYKIFNFTVLKAYCYEDRTEYKLFGFIPVMKKSIV